jgi:hypothetical protein
MDGALLGVIIGGIIGVTGSVVGPLCLAYVQRRAERKNLACALAAEIAALIDIVERRQYIAGLRQLIEVARNNQDLNGAFFYQFSVRRNPLAVYDANLSRIGLLKPTLSVRIARFYAQASAILEDIADFREGRIPEGRDDSVRRLEELLQLFEDSQTLGREIVNEIH